MDDRKQDKKIEDEDERRHLLGDFRTDPSCSCHSAGAFLLYGKPVRHHIPANFIFLAIIALLCEKLLTVTIKLSQLEEKVEIMAAEIAIRTQKTEQKEQELRSRGGNNEGIADSDHV